MSKSIADKLAVAASHVAGGKQETAVVKATRTDLMPPKEKHVRALILSTQDGAVQMSDMVGAIMLRLENANWNVILKTLMLCHRLMRDGSNRFVDELKYRPKVFPLERFNDSATVDGQRNSEFVRKYSLYLEERVNVHKSIKVDFTKKPNACKNLNVDDMFVKLPKLQSLVNALLNTRVPRPDLNNSLVMYAFQYLLKDSFALYTCLSDGMINLIERFFEMNKSDAQRAFDIYKLFVKETDSIIALYDMCRGFANNIPEVDKTPTGLQSAMEEHLNELKGTKPKKNKKDKDKKTKEAKKKAKEMKKEPQSQDLFAVDWEQQASASSSATTANGAQPAPGFGADPFGGDPFGATKMSVSTQVPSVGAAAAAPVAQQGSFDPFASTTQQPVTGLSTDEKMRRILMVQQMSASAGGVPGALESSATPLTPLQPGPAQPAPVTGMPAFNPFPQQPLAAGGLLAPTSAPQPVVQPQATPATNTWAQNPFM